MTSNKLRYSTNGVLALVGLAVLFGAAPAIARYLSGGLGLFEQWYLRYAIATIVGALAFHRLISWRKFLHLPRREWLVLLFRVVVGQVIATALYTMASERAKVGLVAFMDVVPMSSLLGILLFREHLSWHRGFLMALAFVGAGVVVVRTPHDLSDINIGAILTLVSLVFYGLMLVTRKWHTDKLNNYEISVALAALSFAITYILSVVLYHRWIIPAAHWGTGFAVVLVVGACLTIAVNFLMNYGFEHVSAVIAGNILSLEEFFGPLLGYMFYHEVLSPRDIVGGLIILVSVLLMNQSARREHQAIQIAIVPD